jgi:hypothetical protein
LQYDAFEIGFITTDDFTNADILEATYPAVAKSLHGDWISDPAIPIVTGFLGKVFPLANCSAGHLVCEIHELSFSESFWIAHHSVFFIFLIAGMEILCYYYIRSWW